MDTGFRRYDGSLVQGLQQTRVWKGKIENLSLGLQHDLHVTVPRGQYKNLDAVMKIEQDIEAPVQKGKKLGVVRVMLDGKELISRPLVALQDVNEGSMWQRTRDPVIRMFQ